MADDPIAPQALTVALPDGGSVSALLQQPDAARALLVLAHGAGAGMQHSFMAATATGLAARGIGTLRYQFPYMERGSKRTDPPAVAQATVRAAVAAAAQSAPRLPLFAGGKSFGGRMSSQAQSAEPLAGVAGLVFLGFPLHAAGKPDDARGAHLSAVQVPMLFLQGTADKLAEPALLRPLTAALGPHATVHWFDQADHSFHVPVRSGRRDADVMDELLDTLAAWIDTVLAGKVRTAG